jgi:hypothetical protein
VLTRDRSAWEHLRVKVIIHRREPTYGLNYRANPKVKIQNSQVENFSLIHAMTSFDDVIKKPEVFYCLCSKKSDIYNLGYEG